jgi:DNA-binding response OmpR family regulator
MARKAVTAILRRQGFAVSEAATVAQALAALDARPDWVMLDLMLPDGCGTAVLKKAKSVAGAAIGAGAARACRVCVVTGCGPAKFEEARALGPELLLKKPLDVDRLLAALRA